MRYVASFQVNRMPYGAAVYACMPKRTHSLDSYVLPIH